MFSDGFGVGYMWHGTQCFRRGAHESFMELSSRNKH